MTAPYLLPKDRKVQLFLLETKMLSTILLRWWKSLLMRLPPRKIKRKRERKLQQNSLAVLHAIALVTSLVHHLPPGRLSPPWALFGQGPYLQHSDRLHPGAVVSGSRGLAEKR